MATITNSSLDPAALDQMQRKLQLPWEDVAAILGVDQSTLWRWRKHESSPRPLALSRLTQLGELLEFLPRLFAGPDLARTWLREARPESLGGSAMPLDAMRAGHIDRVLIALHVLAHGG